MSIALLETASAALASLVDDVVFVGGATIGLWITDPAASAAFPHALERVLPSGSRIAAVSPEFLVATKLEAFAGRGCSDYMGSRDFADLVSLFDGRVGLPEEIALAPVELRRYVASELARHQQHPRFLDGIYGGLNPEAASQDRAERVVVPRMAVIAASSING